MLKERYDYLRNQCEEISKRVTALEVMVKVSEQSTLNISSKEMVGALSSSLKDKYFTGLMVMMGYPIPTSGEYSLNDYSELCNLLQEVCNDKYEIVTNK